MTFLALCVLLGSTAQAQLAITEIMALGALNDTNQSGADFWELTNFGTNSIDLSGCQYADKNDSWVALPSGLVIGSNESIVFFQIKTNAAITNEDVFREWWGLAPGSRVFALDGMTGLNRFVDSARLRDANGHEIDRVDFGTSRLGVSITYDCVSGVFGVDSTNGVGCAFMAMWAPDVGSPCTNCGPVALRILTSPTNVEVPLGCDAEFSVEAIGMPPPKYQWSVAGQPIEGATGRVFRILGAQPADAGIYCVAITNGLEVLPPLCATLTVTTNRSAPSISSSPKNCTVIVNQPATFTAGFCAYPPPTLQWFAQGSAVPEGTNRTLTIPNCQLEMSGLYCLQVSNEIGIASTCAFLTVITNGTLKFTEVMARSRTNNAARTDWVEITNFGTNSLDLSGFRFVASRGLGMDGASVIPDGVVVKSCESILCVENRTREQFIAWWGANNVPHDVQIITWRGWGIDPEGTEAITLWDASTEDQNRIIHQVFTDVFEEGVSLYFDDDECPRGCVSISTDRGTFYALQGGELGSPSYELVPNIHLNQQGAAVVLTGRSRAGRNYSLQYKNDLRESWSELASKTATNAAVLFDDGPLRERRFYRLKELP